MSRSHSKPFYPYRGKARTYGKGLCNRQLRHYEDIPDGGGYRRMGAGYIFMVPVFEYHGSNRRVIGRRRYIPEGWREERWATRAMRK